MFGGAIISIVLVLAPSKTKVVPLEKNSETPSLARYGTCTLIALEEVNSTDWRTPPIRMGGLTSRFSGGTLEICSDSEKHPDTGARIIARETHIAATRAIIEEWDSGFKESFKGSNPSRGP